MQQAGPSKSRVFGSRDDTQARIPLLVVYRGSGLHLRASTSFASGRECLAEDERFGELIPLSSDELNSAHHPL